MEPQQLIETQEVEKKSNHFNTVTPLSKYLAVLLFIIMPFFGGWIGYAYVPEKIIEVERVVVKEVEKNTSTKPESGVTSLRQIDNDFFRVGNDVYWLTFSENSLYSAFAEPILLKLPDADADTFEPRIVEQFKVSQGNTYQDWISRDKNHVYYRDKIVFGADPATYRIGENVSVNYDADHVFLWHEVIPDADPATYEIILDTSAAGRGTVYGKDINSCYVDYEVVSCAEGPFSS